MRISRKSHRFDQLGSWCPLTDTEISRWADHAYGSAQCVALARASDDCLINPDTMSLIACGKNFPFPNPMLFPILRTR